MADVGPKADMRLLLSGSVNNIRSPDTRLARGHIEVDPGPVKDDLEVGMEFREKQEEPGLDHRMEGVHKLGQQPAVVDNDDRELSGRLVGEVERKDPLRCLS